jgi:hypothetical protein
MPRPSHPSWLDRPNDIWRSVQITKLLIMQSFPASHHFLSLRSLYPLEHPIFKHPQSLPLMSEIKFHTHTKEHDNFNLNRAQFRIFIQIHKPCTSFSTSV